MSKKIMMGMVGVLCFVLLSSPCWAEPIKVGVLKLTSMATTYIGLEKGYFKEFGVDVEPIFFKSAQPIAVATASGDLDVGAAGMTAGLFNSIAGGLNIRIVAGRAAINKDYRLVALLVSPEAWKAGIRTIKDLKGKRVGVTQIGSTFYYILGNLLEQNGMTLKDVEVVNLGAVSSMRDTVITNQIPAAFLVNPFVDQVVQEKKAHIMLWAGEHLDFQIGGMIYGEKFMKNRKTCVDFMKGYIKSCRDYYDNGLLKKDPKAYEDIIGFIAKHTGNKPEIIKMSLSYNVRNGEIDSKEIQQQLDWWFKHGLVTKHLKVDEVVDNSFVQQALKEMGK